jgi:mRNA-degrading endonuclease toxin of MazEF toxin-antitoxin module
MTRTNSSGIKPAEGKSIEDEPLLFLDLYEANKILFDNFKSKKLESNIKWLLGFEHYVDDKKKAKINFKNYTKGTIILVDFFGNFGNEFTYDHPAIVLREDSGLLLIAPLTSNPTKYKDDVSHHIKLPKDIRSMGNSKKNSTILLEQMRTISKNRVLDKYGRVSNNEKLKEIDLMVMEYIGQQTYATMRDDYENKIKELEKVICDQEELIRSQKELMELQEEVMKPQEELVVD